LKQAAKSLASFLVELARAQHRDQLILRAAALAYTTLLSLVPLLTVALALVARLQPQRAEAIVQAIAAVFPFTSAQVTATLTAFAERTISLGWAAIVISALITINAFFQIEAVMNAIWGVVAQRKLRWRLASFLAVLIWGPLLLLLLFSLLYWLQSHPTLRALAPFTRPLPALFAFTVLAALYRWVPHARVPWRAVAAGAAVAAAALTLIHLGFQVYLDLATSLNVVYGSLAIVLFFLVSLFLFWFAVLLGAEASWVVGRQQRSADPLPGDAAVALLAAMAADGTVEATRVASFLGSDAHQVLARLATDPPLITPTPQGWRLARPADELTVADVRTRLGVAAAEGNPSGEQRSLAATAKLSSPRQMQPQGSDNG
jgi:membrane protein